MSDPVEVARNRLMEWGAWARSGGVSALGFSSQACHLSGLSGGRDYALENNPAAEEIETILQVLRIENRLWFRIIKQHYMRGASYIDGAIWLRIKVGIYKDRKGKAEAWVAGALSRGK